MSRKVVYSICGMCQSRCPIQAEVEEDRCLMLQGNLRAPGIKGALCARGSAGLAQVQDDQRPQFPLLRQGERGQGLWKRVSWEEALDLAAAKLSATAQEAGAKSIIFSAGDWAFSDQVEALARGLGTPNYYQSDSTCSVNVQHAALSLFGLGESGLCYDFKRARHVVLQTRNALESINVAEVNDLLDGLASGGRLTVIDIRATVTASKADRFLLVRPGSDYALNLAVIHVLIQEGLYDKAYCKAHLTGLRWLTDFVQPYTPEFAAQETGVPPAEIVALARELAAAAPAVIWHPGWMTARYQDSFYLSRSAYIINALLGSIGAPGGLPLAASPEDLGLHGLKRFVDLFPPVSEPRVDAEAWKIPGPGLLHLAFKAMETGQPYPLKAYVAWQHDPLAAYPDPPALKQAFAKLDFLLCVTPSWTDTAWQADLVLPLSSYLERNSLLWQKNGIYPTIYRRARCIEPRFDTKDDWQIVGGLARRMGLGQLDLDSAQAIWAWQLEGTGHQPADLEETGYIQLSPKPVYIPLAFPTASGKIEVQAPAWQEAGLDPMGPYVKKPSPPPGHFRLTIGRCSVHSQEADTTGNNPQLQPQMPENVLWLNQDLARRMGIADGEMVEVASPSFNAKIRAKLTQHIHPEACFMVHGFGRKVPMAARSYGKGVADNALMAGGLGKSDPAGGGLALQEHFVAVRKVYAS